MRKRYLLDIYDNKIKVLSNIILFYILIINYQTDILRIF